jgi:hypothetical protein
MQLQGTNCNLLCLGGLGVPMAKKESRRNTKTLYIRDD